MDYAMARHYRQKEMNFVREWIEEINRSSSSSPGKPPDAGIITAKALECLVQIMSSR